MVRQGVRRFPIEDILDPDELYYRVNHTFLRKGLRPSIFQIGGERGNELSADWCKYSTPRRTLKRAPKEKENDVVSMIAGRIRHKARLIVDHSPVEDDPELIDNQAHSLIYGWEDEEDFTEARRLLFKLVKVEIENPKDF